MKKLLILAVVGALASSCNSDQKESAPAASPSSPEMSSLKGGPITGKLNVSSMRKMAKVDLVSKLKLSVLTTDGQLVSNISDLRPNTNYNVVVEGNNDLQVRACLGFDLLEQTSTGKVGSNFSIRTHSDVLESPMISVVPMRRVGNVLFREQAQMLSLVK